MSTRSLHSAVETDLVSRPGMDGRMRYADDLPSGAVSETDLEDVWSVLQRAVGTISVGLAQTLHAAGLRPAEWSVLTCLAAAPDHQLPMSTLAGAVALTSGGFTKLADRMEDRGLLGRRASATDRRVIYAVLTPDGVAAHADARPRYLAALRRMLEGTEGVTELRALATACAAICGATAGPPAATPDSSPDRSGAPAPTGSAHPSAGSHSPFSIPATPPGWS